jgi:hypothetical protein
MGFFGLKKSAPAVCLSQGCPTSTDESTSVYMASDHLDLLLQWVQVKKRPCSGSALSILLPVFSYPLSKGDQLASSRVRATDSIDDSLIPPIVGGQWSQTNPSARLAN